MQLYSFFNSSTSYRVRIALALKALDYEYHGVNLRTGEQRSSPYAELNPAKGVPLLVCDDGTQLTQSLVIIDALDQIQPEPRLIPLDAEKRIRVLELSSLIACDIHPVNNVRILGYLQKELGVTAQQKDAWYRHWVAEGLVAVEALLEKYGYGPFCFGEQPTLADCCLVPQVANAARMNCPLDDYPRIMAVYRHCQEQAAFQQAAPQHQPDYIG